MDKYDNIIELMDLSDEYDITIKFNPFGILILNKTFPDGRRFSKSYTEKDIKDFEGTFREFIFCFACECKALEEFTGGLCGTYYSTKERRRGND